MTFIKIFGYNMFTLFLIYQRRSRIIYGLLLMACSCSLPPSVHAQEVFISEFVASNQDGIKDAYGDSSDWIELYNNSDNVVDLDGWSLTDDPGQTERWVFPIGATLGRRAFLTVFASERDDRLVGEELHTDFKLEASGEYLALLRPDGSVAHEYASTYPSQFLDVSYGVGMVAGVVNALNEGANCRYKVPTDGWEALTWTTLGYTDTAWSHGTTGIGYERAPADYANLINSTIPEGSLGCYVRIPFSITDPQTLNQLLLRMKYDDGFVAYLNGVQVAEANAPSSPFWNSTATADHPDVLAVESEEFNISAHCHLLVEGNNLLAIHTLNTSSSSSDMLCLPSLVAHRGGLSDPLEIGFLSSSTPDTINSGMLSGPWIGETTHNPTPPLDAADLVVTCKVVSVVHPLTPSTVTLHYRVMFGSEISLPMTAQGNDVFAATIPHSAAAAGEMLRWYVTANDNQSNQTRHPAFAVPLDSPAYHGTVVVDPAIQSLLPVLHWFVQNPTAANTDAGTRGSVFFLGRFYDNILTDVHGQSTRGFPKKSYDFDFNRGERFRYAEGEGKVKDINLLTNYADKSKVRNTLGYELARNIGIRAHWAFPVRVEQNGAFFSVADMVEDGDNDYLARAGMDPDGVLYKVYDRLESTAASEKKTRKDEDKSDLQSLIDGLALPRGSEALRQFLYDHVDLPGTINYLVGQDLMSNRDFAHKNYYIYRDTNGTKEWTILTWDVDLCLGHIWTVDPHYFDDAMYVNNLLHYTENNRLFDAMYSIPEIERMYYRRLRRVLDQELQPPGTPVAEDRIQKRMDDLIALIDPPSISPSDADLDYNKWGSWGDYKDMVGSCNRIRTEFLPGRRDFLYVSGQAHLIPAAATGYSFITFGTVESDPDSGNQDQEFIELINTSTTIDIDISDWTIRGGVAATIKPGTVLPRGHSLFLTPETVAFRARTVSPKGSEGYLVQTYDGHLSNFGETLTLYGADGSTVVDQMTTPTAPTPAQLQLRVSELHIEPLAGNPLFGEPALPSASFEFIELINTSATEALDLNGVQLTDGVLFNFTGSAITNLLPGAYVIVVADTNAFSERYGSGYPIAGVYTGMLNNAGEHIKMDDARGNTITSFSYGKENAGWPYRVFGGGSSLENVALSDEPDSPASWRPSTTFHGSPGSAGEDPLGAVVINEILSHTDFPQSDSIELLNRTGQAIDIGNWLLSDEKGNYQKFIIPAPTLLPAASYLVFDEGDFNPTPSTPLPQHFAFNGAHGDEVWLVEADASGKPLRFVDDFYFGAQANGEAWGRWLNGEGLLYPRTAYTPLAANVAPRIGPVVISEIMYNVSGDTNGLLEFVEIHNPGPATENLSNWMLTNGLNYAFAPGTSLTAGKTLVLVSFDPTTQTAETENFRSHYGINPLIPLAGPFNGRLDNAGETLRLHRPDSPPIEEPGFYPMLLEDEVRYSNERPWPLAPDGGGDSLTRVQADLWGNAPSSWIAAVPSPGSYSATPLAGYAAWKLSSFPLDIPSALREFLADPDEDGRDNLTEYALGGNPNSYDAVAYRASTAVTNAGSSTFLKYIYNRRIDAASLGLSYGVAYLLDLTSTNSWTDVGGLWEIGTNTINAEFESITNEVDITGINEGFLRLEISIAE